MAEYKTRWKADSGRTRTPLRAARSMSGARRGVTLIEILVVIGIVVILVAVLVPIAGGVRDSGRAQLARSVLTRMQGALEKHAQEWKRLHRTKGWRTTVDLGGGVVVPLTVPGAPQMSFDDSGGTPSIPVWDSYLNDQRLTAGGALIVQPGRAVENRPGDRRFEINQCLTYALTAPAGGESFLPRLEGDTLKPGRYTHPITEQPVPAAAIGATVYPVPDGSTPAPGDPQARPKQHLVDPWGEPYLYGWEIQVDTSGAAPVAAFVRPWVASSGPDRASSFPEGAAWIRDAKLATGSTIAGATPDLRNVDNVVP